MRAIEQASDATVEHLTAELERLGERLKAGGDADAEKLQAIGEVVVGHAQAVTDWSGAIRRWLESEGAQHRGAPSDGVILLARRMTIAGIPTRKIEALLAGLGVPDPQAAVRHALRTPEA